jgi:ATP-dependent exoDNAse (exonuclease V) beta subunit
MTRAEHHLVLSFSATGRQPANWDKLAIERLTLDPGRPCDRVAVYHAPGGQPWKARIRVVHEVPEPSAPEPSAPELLPLPRAPREETPVLQVSPPAVEEQQDGNATVTALSLFASCPRKYYLSRYLGFEGRARKAGEAALASGESAGLSADLSASAFGTQVHALLAGNAVADPVPEALRLAEVFRRGPLGRRAARAARAAREFDFLMAMEDLVIRGQVDLWFEEGGELVVVDYKTDEVSGAEAHHRARDYGLQLRLYARAVERVAGRAPDRAWLHFLRPNTLVEVDLTPTLIDGPEQTVRDFQEAQSKLDFPLIEGEQCKRCPFFRDLCPAGG